VLYCSTRVGQVLMGVHEVHGLFILCGCVSQHCHCSVAFFQVSLCGDTLLPCRGDSEGPHSAHTCWNCRSFLARRLVVQPHTSGVAGYAVQVSLTAGDKTVGISWWRWCCPCWVEGITCIVVVLYKVAVLLFSSGQQTTRVLMQMCIFCCFFKYIVRMAWLSCKYM